MRHGALLGSMIPLRKDAPNTATWIGNIACVPGDEVDMNMHSGLTAGFAYIDADVVTIWRMLLLH